MPVKKTNGDIATVDTSAGVVWRGPDALRPFLVPVDRLHEDPANINTHPDRSIESIAASYARFGQQKPLVVDPAGVVRAGNGQLRAASERLGWTHVAAVTSDLAGTDLTAYSLADNRVADFSEFDAEALAVTLRALQSEDFDLSAVGYRDDEVDALLAKMTRDVAGPLAFTADPDDDYTDEDPPPRGDVVGDEDDVGEVSPPESHVRMVQLFLTVETFPEFQRLVAALAKRYETANPTDTVMAVLREAEFHAPGG